MYFERFSTEDGMPSTSVVGITQDQDGFIWLGTWDGLVKYDGYQFLTFRNIPGDSTIFLNHNSIEAIYVTLLVNYGWEQKLDLIDMNRLAIAFFDTTPIHPILIV